MIVDATSAADSATARKRLLQRRRYALAMAAAQPLVFPHMSTEAARAALLGDADAPTADTQCNRRESAKECVRSEWQKARARDAMLVATRLDILDHRRTSKPSSSIIEEWLRDAIVCAEWAESREQQDETYLIARDVMTESHADSGEDEWVSSFSFKTGFSGAQYKIDVKVSADGTIEEARSRPALGTGALLSLLRDACDSHTQFHDVVCQGLWRLLELQNLPRAC